MKMALIYENRKYLGKTLKKEGGEGDKAWKLYEAIFEAEGKYDFKCKIFGSCKGFDFLEEGNTICIGYEEGTYEHSEYGNIKTRTIKHVKKEDKQQQTLQPTTEPTQKIVTTEVVNPDTGISIEEDNFFTTYKEKMIESGLSMTDMNKQHMLGTWVLYHKRDLTYEYTLRLSMLFEQLIKPKQ